MLTSRQKNILLGLALAFIIFIVLFVISQPPSSKQANLEMWGIYDSPQVINNLISNFHRAHPNINIIYTQKDPASYYRDLIESFANNKAPDIFFLFGNWVPLFENKISGLDLKKDPDFNLRTLNEIYPQIVQDDLVSRDSLLGIPMSIDTLALYYNKDIFDYYKIPQPPQSWQDILNLIPKLRKINPQGQITRAAIALGTTNNINWSTDILSALMMQLNPEMVDKQNALFLFNNPLKNGGLIPAQEALKAYTQLADPQSTFYTWQENFPNDIYAFSQGQTAMIIGYHLANQVISEQSPTLRYGITNFPSFNIISNPYPLNYGRTMNYVVSNRSQAPKAAWQFLKYLSSKEAQQYYFEQTQNPPCRKDLFSLARNDEKLGVFVDQIFTSRNWYQFNFQAINTSFNKMVNDILVGNLSIKDAVSNAIYQLELEWRKQIQSLKNI